MKILSIITPIGYGGGENQLVLLCKEFKKLGIEIAVINLTKSEEFEKILKEIGVPFLTLSNYKIGFGVSQKEYLNLFFKLIPYIISQKPVESTFGKVDLLWAHGFPANASAVLMRKTGKVGKYIKLVYSHHSLKSPMSGLARLIYERILDSFDLIVGVSSKTSKSLVKVFPKLKEKIITI
ncbi:MAG: glycosyltransferase, partial [bacterium]